MNKSKGRKPQFNQKQVERMRHMLSEGFRQHDIARIMGVTKSTIGRYLAMGTEIHTDKPGK